VRELVARVEGLGDLFAYQEQLGLDEAEVAKVGSPEGTDAGAEYPRSGGRSA
jgi:hypothetical protein